MICICNHSIEKSHIKEDNDLIGLYCKECKAYCIVSPIFWREEE